MKFRREATALSNAGSAYAQNPTQQNCQAYVDAGNSYIDAAEQLESCARNVGQLQEYQQALDGARAAINSLAC